MPVKEFHIEGIGKVTVYKRRGSRSLRLTLTPAGVRVSIPTWTPYSTGLSFAESKRTWIVANMPLAAEPLTNGQPVGRTRRLTFVPDYETPTIKTGVRASEVVVWFNPRFADSDTPVQRAAELASWRALKSESIKLLTPRLNELAERHQFQYLGLSFKRMKSRWGSCDHRQNIVLNIFLVQLPWECIDYVLLHELTHTRVLHHGPDFWEALERVLPGARTFKRTMRAYHPVLGVYPQPDNEIRDRRISKPTASGANCLRSPATTSRKTTSYRSS